QPITPNKKRVCAAATGIFPLCFARQREAHGVGESRRGLKRHVHGSIPELVTSWRLVGKPTKDLRCDRYPSDQESIQRHLSNRAHGFEIRGKNRRERVANRASGCFFLLAEPHPKRPCGNKCKQKSGCFMPKGGEYRPRSGRLDQFKFFLK